ncbi:hypothetical protein SAY86_008540 [Trapa natans]|uniref:Uncharacterized protein n=1 Tax=Trapa natans TaxID=22666 RepID=A0AAN7KFJ7_TRANT|nr:hypothetical protein SAY86_008540 [Trapa natans]
MPKFQAATPSSAFIVFHRPLPPPPPPTTPSPPVPVLLLIVAFLLVLPLGLRICLYLILGLGTGLALGVLPMGDRDLLRLFLTVAVIFALRQLMQTLVWILAVSLLGFIGFWIGVTIGPGILILYCIKRGLGSIMLGRDALAKARMPRFLDVRVLSQAGFTEPAKISNHQQWKDNGSVLFGLTIA